MQPPTYLWEIMQILIVQAKQQFGIKKKKLHYRINACPAMLSPMRKEKKNIERDIMQ